MLIETGRMANVRIHARLGLGPHLTHGSLVIFDGAMEERRSAERRRLQCLVRVNLRLSRAWLPTILKCCLGAAVNGGSFDANMATVGDRIKQRRLELGFSQRELADDGHAGQCRG